MVISRPKQYSIWPLTGPAFIQSIQLLLSAKPQTKTHQKKFNIPKVKTGRAERCGSKMKKRERF